MSVISQMSVILLKTSNWTITITITMTINMTVTMTLKERHHIPKQMFFLTNCGMGVESNQSLTIVSILKNLEKK